MTLNEVIEQLRKRDPTTVVRHGFGSGHSDRGYYCDAAFDPVEETTFGEMLKHAEALLDTEQEGYKGGVYIMGGHVTAHIGEWGSSGEEITRTHFRYWDTFAS